MTITMNNDPAFISGESIVPSLFQIAARADAPPLTTPELVNHRTLAEMTLNPKRLKAILDAVVKKKKAASR